MAARQIDQPSRVILIRHHVKGLSKPFLSGDKKSLWVQADTAEGTSIELELPFALADQLVSAFAQAAQHASNEAGDSTIERPNFSDEMWEMIPVRGLGLSFGRSPNETALVVDLFRFRLALLLDSKKVAALGASFARMAATLSADPTKKL